MIEVLFFGPVVESVGASEVHVKFHAGMILQDVRAQLQMLHPAAFEIVCFAAVNGEHALGMPLPLSIARWFLCRGFRADNMRDAVRIQQEDFSQDEEKKALQACYWLIDELKQRVPIWKKEITPQGDAWVTLHP